MSKFSLNLNLGGAGQWFKKLVCQHPIDQLEFMRNIYGDEINHVGGMRSIWRCRVCDKLVYRPDPINFKERT